MQSVLLLKLRRTQRMLHNARLLKHNRQPRVLRAPRTRLCKRRRRLRPAATLRTREWIACSSSPRRSKTTKMRLARAASSLEPPHVGGFFLPAMDGRLQMQDIARGHGCRHAENAGAICGAAMDGRHAAHAGAVCCERPFSAWNPTTRLRPLSRAALRYRRPTRLRERRCRAARCAPLRSNRAALAVLPSRRCRRA